MDDQVSLNCPGSRWTLTAAPGASVPDVILLTVGVTGDV